MEQENKDWRTLPQGERRCRFIRSRATETQYAQVQALADKCEMTISDYVLARCCNYEPRARVTGLEQSFADELTLARTDYRRYYAMLQTMTKEQRRKLFSNEKWMANALRLLQAQQERIDAILDRVFGANPLPPRTRNKPQNKD